MPAKGQSLPIHSVPVPTVVRYTSDNDRLGHGSERTRSAKGDALTSFHKPASFDNPEKYDGGPRHYKTAPVDPGRSSPSRFAYLTRFQCAAALAPTELVGFVYLNSSAVSDVIIRFASLPLRFGNVPPSIWVIRVLSASFTE